MDSAFPVFTLFAFLFVLIPLPWHVQAWNVGTCAYIFWAALACLFEFVNAIVWRNSVSNIAPVWCDISSKFLLGAGVGIPAAGLCISRRLYTISAIRTAIVTYEDKRRAVIIDSCIAFGIPVLIMVLHYVVQGHRFDILEDVGCYPTTYNTLLAYFLVLIWPILLGCVSFVLSALTLRAFYKRRLEFTQFLSTHNSLSMNRYIRLMLLAVSEMVSTIPISICSIYLSTKGVPLQPWISWANTHHHFSYVGQVPAVVWRSNPNYRIAVELTRWLFPASALLFFLLFGFGTEARKNYRAAFLWVAKSLGYNPASTNTTPQWKSSLNKNISVGSLPVFVPAPSARVKPAKSFMPSTAKCSDADIEKSAACSSRSLSSCSPRDEYPSPTATCIGADTDESGETVAGFTPSRPVPAFHRPFTQPSVCPVLPHTVQLSRSSFDSVRITVQTQHSVAV